MLHSLHSILLNLGLGIFWVEWGTVAVALGEGGRLRYLVRGVAGLKFYSTVYFIDNSETIESFVAMTEMCIFLSASFKLKCRKITLLERKRVVACCQNCFHINFNIFCD